MPLKILLLSVMVGGPMSPIIQINTYADGRALALERGKKLVVFYGSEQRYFGDDVIYCRAYDLEGFQKPCTIIAAPRDGNLWVDSIRREGDSALEEVNAARAARGLQPFIEDPALTSGAVAAAQFRAGRGIIGHTSNDFSFLPSGANAGAAGCAAVGPEWGFRACCVFENWRYAGAASIRGPDGRIYHHLFVR